jgi:hypothetical protein
MTDPPDPSPIDAFLDAVHESGCQLATLLAHMEGWREGGNSAPDAPAPAEALRRLLADVLTPALNGLADEDIRAASRAMALAVTTVSDEVLLVAPESRLAGRSRRRRRSRR